MAEKVNKSYISYDYHSIINLCAFLFVMSPSAEKGGSLAVYDLSRNIRYISWVRSQIRYSSTSMTGGMCFRTKSEGKCMSEHCFC